MAKGTVAAVGLVLVCAAVGLGDVLSIPASHDNTLYQDPAGGLSNGAGPSFFVGENGDEQLRRGLLYFDVAGALPNGCTITAATLTLHMSRTVAGPTDVSLHRALASWGEGSSQASGEGGSGAPAQPGDATWIYRFYNTQSWTTPGGDFASSASATTSVAAVGFYNWSSAGLLADVQDWHANPAANYGWVVLGDESFAASTKRFDTRENTTAQFRPVLQLTYYVPEPATLGAALVGLAFVARRRRLRAL